MATKIRLSRHGRKGRPFYHIVVADSRSPRDGKFIERIGSYNPNTNPATIDLNFEKALHWMNVGAQPTDTARSILSYKGVLMMKHLMEGVKKGAFDQAEAEKRFAAWTVSKEQQISNKVSGLAKSKEDEAKARLEAEIKINEARKEAIAKRIAEANAEAAAAAAPAEEEATEAPAENNETEA